MSHISDGTNYATLRQGPIVWWESVLSCRTFYLSLNIYSFCHQQKLF